MKKYNHYILLEQSEKSDSFEYLIVEGSSYLECLKSMPRIKKGYIMGSNEEDASIRYSSDDKTCKIVKTKGWE